MMNPNATALENLCEIVCASACAKFIEIRDRRVYFAPDVKGEPPIEFLPVAEFNSHAVRLALKKYRAEKVEVIR
jgi:hypothetical protein